MKNYLLILAILLGLVSCQFRPVAELRFHENGRFKIVQFTDLHWAPGLPSSAQTTATIQHLLQTEKPDLAVLTGDVVTATPAEAGWTAIVDLFDKARVPFTVVMGNHDAEQQVTRRQIYQWLARSPYFVGEEGPGDIHGCGNFVLPIMGSHSDGQAVVDNDGSHSARHASGKVALEAGFHDLELLYFESYMGEELEVGMASRHSPESLIPDSLLFLPR